MKKLNLFLALCIWIPTAQRSHAAAATSGGTAVAPRPALPVVQPPPINPPRQNPLPGSPVNPGLPASPTQRGLPGFTNSLVGLTNNLATGGTNRFGTNEFTGTNTFAFTNQFGTSIVPVELQPLLSDLQVSLVRLQPLLQAIANNPALATIVSQSGTTASTQPASTSGANLSTALGANTSTRLGVNSGANLSSAAGGTTPTTTAATTPTTAATAANLAALSRVPIAGLGSNGVAATSGANTIANQNGNAINSELAALQDNVNRMLTALNIAGGMGTSNGVVEIAPATTTVNSNGVVTPLTPTGRQ